MSLYNLASPILSLLTPIFILIVPFFIIKMKGLELTVSEYIEVLKVLAESHAIGKLFTQFNDVTINEKIYLLVSAAFYIFSIYQNIHVCIKFHANMIKIHNHFSEITKYLDYTIKSMDNYLVYASEYPTQNDFCKTLREKKQKLEELIIFTSSHSRSFLTKSDVGGIVSQGHLDILQKSEEIEEIYLANSLQSGFIYHSLNQDEADDTNWVQIIFEYHSEIHVDKLKEAWQFAQKKFPALRLKFDWEELLIQIIYKAGNLDWVYIDLSDTSNILVQQEKINQIIKQDVQNRYLSKNDR
jgi:hypothetical protein